MREKVVHWYEESLNKPFTAAYSDLATERHELKHLPKVSDLENQGFLCLAVDVEELGETMKKHKWLDVAAKSASKGSEKRCAILSNKQKIALEMEFSQLIMSHVQQVDVVAQYNRSTKESYAKLQVSNNCLSEVEQKAQLVTGNLIEEQMLSAGSAKSAEKRRVS